ncbi:protein turtle homolog A isoform X4 [Microplitis mediator]|uniref:protein turtle homolog A isoform X4 n=1 Tax=Microplitis mediator TaxID=375433 RepID=UPI0025548114|nr:protein turtle homolog A isoform X4 [Microplitis mediator]
MIKHGIIFLLLLVLPGWQEALGSVSVRTVEVDIGQNLTIACTDENVSRHPGNYSNVMWVREGRKDGQVRRMKIGSNKALELVNVSLDDAGNYFCTLDNDANAVKTRINIQVKTPPPALHNVWVKPSTILANILWEVAGTGGYPIIDFTAEYRLKPGVGEEPEDWKPIMPTHIPSNSRQIDVYHLEPNTTYLFRVWATNKLGRGEIVQVEGHTHHTVEELAQLEDQEVIELVPNIILNPGFFDERSERQHQLQHQDENFNNQTTTRLNNNTVILPRRL